MKFTTTAFALLAGLSLSVAAQAALHDRGGGLIYDDVLDITWLQDANYGRTIGTALSWDGAKSWAANLDYYDSIRNVTWSDWRLPRVTPQNGVNFNYTQSNDGTTDIGWNITSTSSEMSYMYYVNLGNKKGGFSNTGPFTNLDHVYWTETPSSIRLSSKETAFFFQFVNDAQQNVTDTPSGLYAWGVRDGDVAAIPEPETYAMLLTGLGLIGIVALRRKTAQT